MSEFPRFEERYDHERGFSSYFSEHLSPILMSLERERRQKLFLYFLALAILWGGLGLFAYEEIHEKGLNAERVLSVLGLILFAYFPSGLIKHFFEKKVKAVVMPEIMAFFPNAKYTVDSHVKVSDIKDFLIVPHYTHAEGADLICYSEKFSLSYLRLKYRRGTSRQGDNNITFYGLCILMSLNKRVSDPIAIKVDDGRVINWFKNLGTGYERISMGPNAFEKMFEVYGKNKNEVRSVLTVELMELFLKLNFLFANLIITPPEMDNQIKKVLSGWNGWRGKEGDQSGLMANFMGDRLLLLIPTSEAMFKPASLFKSCTDTTAIRTILYQIKLLDSVYEMLVRNLK